MVFFQDWLHLHMPFLLEQVPYGLLRKPLLTTTYTHRVKGFCRTLSQHYKEVKSPKGFINNDSPSAIKAMKEWIGINYDGNIYYDDNHSPGQVLRNCVHPELGLHIFNESKRFGFFSHA